jgi:hypothetical protein
MPINITPVTVSTDTSGLQTDPYPASPGAAPLRSPLPGEPAAVDQQLDADIQAVADKLNEVIAYLASAGADLTGATALGKALVAAATPSDARTVIGAGTSNLTLGAGPTNAAPGDHDHYVGDVLDFSDGVRTVMPRTRTVQASTTLVLTDDYLRVDSASLQTITIPTNATSAFPIGYSATIHRVGTGGVTIAAASGVTTSGTLTGVPQNGSYSVFQYALNAWDVEGGQ